MVFILENSRGSASWTVVPQFCSCACGLWMCGKGTAAGTSLEHFQIHVIVRLFPVEKKEDIDMLFLMVVPS